jgi:uncharacterized iron-regulated membrane protein
MAEGDAGEVVEERWAMVLVTAVIAGVLMWWRRRSGRR